MAGSAFGLGVYTLVIVALYPSFRGDTSLDKLGENGSAVAALFGASGSLTSPSGWMSANVYANLLPLIALMVSIGYGASCLAGQSESGTLGLVATWPVSRRAIVLEKALALAAQPVPLVALTATATIAGRMFDLRLGFGALITTSVAVWLMAVVFGLLAMFLGAVTGSRGIALGIASGTAGLSYLIGSLAPVIGWMHPLQYASAFHYSVASNQLTDGASVADIGALAIVVWVLLAATAHAVRTLEIQ